MGACPESILADTSLSISINFRSKSKHTLPRPERISRGRSRKIDDLYAIVGRCRCFKFINNFEIARTNFPAELYDLYSRIAFEAQHHINVAFKMTACQRLATTKLIKSHAVCPRGSAVRDKTPAELWRAGDCSARTQKSVLKMH